MAERATDILPLDGALRQLGIDPSTLDAEAKTSASGRISPQISAAISVIEAETGLVLVDRPGETYRVVRPIRDTDPIRIRGAYKIRAVEHMDYWAEGDDPNALPSAQIAGADMRYDKLSDRALDAYLYPPTGGWPKMNTSTCPLISVIEGMNTIPPALVQAAKLLVAGFFDGMQRLDNTTAAIRLCRQHQWYGDYHG